MSSYVYVRSEPQLWTVGYHRPDTGKWEPESDHGSAREAAARVHWLNGGCPAPECVDGDGGGTRE